MEEPWPHWSWPPCEAAGVRIDARPCRYPQFRELLSSRTLGNLRVPLSRPPGCFVPRQHQSFPSTRRKVGFRYLPNHDKICIELGQIAMANKNRAFTCIDVWLFFNIGHLHY